MLGAVDTLTTIAADHKLLARTCASYQSNVARSENELLGRASDRPTSKMSALGQ